MIQENTHVILLLFIVATGVLFLVYFTADSMEMQTYYDYFESKSDQASYIYRIISSSCLNNQLDEESDIKTDKFIIDKNKINSIISSSNGIPVLPCIDLPNAKYQIHIKDLETGSLWIFQNYQSSDRDSCDRIVPDYDMAVQINDYSVEPSSPYEIPDLDIYRNGLISIGIESHHDLDLLPDGVVCEDHSREPDNFDEGGNHDTHFDDYYDYEDNNCDSGICMKYPGQANATCQEAGHTYDKSAGDECTDDAECESYSCEAGTCETISPPNRLVDCQPCKVDDDCLSDKCSELKYCVTEVI